MNTPQNNKILGILILIIFISIIIYKSCIRTNIQTGGFNENNSTLDKMVENDILTNTQ